MPIDVDVALGAEFGTVEFSWTATNAQLYNLALGAGADPMDPRELSYVIDRNPQVLPTFGCVAASFNEIEPPKVSWPGVEIDLAKVLHGSEQVTVPAPLPPSGSARAKVAVRLGPSIATRLWPKRRSTPYAFTYSISAGT